MLKILYAADNRYSSYAILTRFLSSFQEFYQIKVAGYTKSLQNLSADWNLDALLDFSAQNIAVSFNDNFPKYLKEIKLFQPDLIISDFEIYTSFVAMELHIPFWQVSPMLLYYGIDQHKKNINKYYSFPIIKDQDRYTYINSIIKNADKRLVLSHLGDLIHSPPLKENFAWVRPSFELPETSICDSSTIALADLYYHNMVPDFQINYQDEECLINHSLNKQFPTPSGQININTNVKFLSQYLKELI